MYVGGAQNYEGLSGLRLFYMSRNPVCLVRLGLRPRRLARPSLPRFPLPPQKYVKQRHFGLSLTTPGHYFAYCCGPGTEGMNRRSMGRPSLLVAGGEISRFLLQAYAFWASHAGLSFNAPKHPRSHIRTARCCANPRF